jgi:membrane protease YdiL (CAAX protease family)
MDDQLLPIQKRRQNLISLAGVVIAIVFPFVLSLLIIVSGLSYPEKVLYSRFIFWAEVLFLMLYASKVEHCKFLIWEDKPADIGFFLVSVVALYFLSLACGIIGSMPRFLGWHENNAAFKRIITTFMNRPWLMLFTAVTAGVTEELIFRGYILTRLSLLFKNRYMPLVISAFAFASLHYSYRSLREYIFTFLIGILFGAYYQKYRNIKVLIVVHFMIDIISLEIGTHFYKLIK